MQKKIVEFIGIAGIGKTTVVEGLCEKLKERKIKYINISRFKSNSLFLKVLTTLKASYISLLLKPKSLNSYINNTIKLSSYFLKINNTIDQNIYLLDEGIFHKTREFQRNSKSLNLNQIIDVLNLYIKFPDYVVVLEAGAKTIYNRRVKRNRDKDKFSFDLIQNYVASFSETINAIEYAKKKYNPSMEIIKLSYDNNISPYQAVSIILDKIDIILKEKKLNE